MAQQTLNKRAGAVQDSIEPKRVIRGRHGRELERDDAVVIAKSELEKMLACSTTSFAHTCP